MAQAGPEGLSPPPENLLQKVANGGRINEIIGEQRVAAVPLVRGGALEGGVILVPGEDEDLVFQLFLRSGIKAAAVTTVLGVGSRSSLPPC